MKIKTGIIAFGIALTGSAFSYKSDSYAYGIGLDGKSAFSTNQDLSGDGKYDQRFLKAMQVIFKREGGYVNHPNDKGGETKYGISKRSYPDVDIASLTRKQAEAIYYRDFWKPEYSKIHNAEIVVKLFDLSVNMGSRTANKILQRALRATDNAVVEDGILASKTIAAINRADPTDLLAAFKSETAGYYRILAEIHPAQGHFLKGWLNRAYS